MPTRWFRLTLVVAVLLGPAMALAISDLTRNGDRPVLSVVTGIGTAILVIDVIAAVLLWKVGRVARRARRPDRRIADWTLTPETWPPSSNAMPSGPPSSRPCSARSAHAPGTVRSR